MHFLIGLAALVGLIAFAFGERAAVTIVQIVLGLMALGAAAFVAAIVVGVMQ
jgi:hypothetical protein